MNTKLSVKAFGLAIGVTWALGVLLVGIAATYFSYGTEFVTAIGSFYIGYDTSLVGCLIGMVWGFIDGFVGGAVIAWLYNKFSG